QLQFLKAFAGLASSDEHLETIEALLDEKQKLTGLPVDADLAWDLLISLVAGDKAGEVAIELQLTKDATASGARRAAHARAALPGVEHKRAAWDLLVNQPEGEDLPNAHQFSATA